MEETKKCKLCEKEFTIDRFRYQNKTLADGSVKKFIRSNCRKCEKKVYYQQDGFFYVYLLPESNYVGMTNNLRRRKRQHRENGLDVQGFKTLGKFNSSVDAHLVETTYHAGGYEGYQYKRLDKKWE